MTSLRQDQYIRVTHLRNRTQTDSVTAGTIPALRLILLRTVRKRLREHHIRPRRPCLRTLALPHPIVLNVYGVHVPIWGGVWESGKLYSSQMNLDLVWIIQMVGLWCTAGWPSATNINAFDGDVRLAVGVWWCGVASQPMTGHPWSLLMAIWMHTATWRMLLDGTCCPSSVVTEGTWPFSRTMLDHTLHVSSWIFSDMRMCWWWLGPRCPPIRVANRALVGRNEQNIETTTKPAHHAARTWISPARRLTRNPTSIPCQPTGSNEASVSGMCQCSRWSHTHYWQCELLFDPPLCCDGIENDTITVESLPTSWAQSWVISKCCHEKL